MADSLIPGLKSEQARRALSEAVTGVMARWQLTDADQAMLREAGLEGLKIVQRALESG